MSFNNIFNKRSALTLLIILIIFSIGFFLRIESVNLSGIPDNEKSFYEDQNGLPYMYELDSYYNYRLTENYINHGYLGDALIDGKNWDLHSSYPPGRSAEYPPLIVYTATLFYYLLNIFTSVPLIVSCFWMPAVIGPLAGVIAYLFVRRFTNDYAAIAAGIFIVTAPYYFIRTVPGWFDTDMFIILFPLLMIWFITEAVYTENAKMRVIFSILAAISVFLFSKAWEAWSFIFYFVIFSFLVYIVIAKLFKLELKNIVQVLLLFAGFTIVFIVLLDFSNFNSITFPFTFYQRISAGLWPNTYISVSEMSGFSLQETISGLGFTFLAGILGILWIFRVLINKKMKEKYLNKMTWFFYLLLVMWTIVGFVAITKGSRFIMLLLPPVAISSGIMVGICIGYFNLLKEKGIKIFKNENVIKLISIGLVVLVALPGVLNDYNTLTSFKPTINDDLWTAAQWINNNTSNDTVIISEWSYGYLLTAVSDRPVSVDGGSQLSPRTYWIFRAFSTDNENLSQGIFRMIATSGDLGPNTLDNYTKNTSKTVEILNNILVLNRDDAMTIMTDKYGLSMHESQNVLNYTHPDNPRPYVLLTTNDMLNKGFWTFYFGLWDFNQMKGHDLTYSFKDNLNVNNRIPLNLENGIVTLDGKTPYMVIINNNDMIEKQYINESSDISVFYLEKYGKPIIIENNHENSLFVKLLIERNNTKNFKAIYQNENVIIWKSA
jgi:dolichyl-diphosphooligosaccharide--protein glycosyltransferase